MSAPRVIVPGRRTGTVTVPASKSLAHREIIAAALSDVPPPVVRGASDDLAATARALTAIRTGAPEADVGESGTTLRLLTPIAGVLGWSGKFICHGRLAERPMRPFSLARNYVVPGNISSQFVSGLLMALPLADQDDAVVAVEGPLQSAAYVQLTEDVLAAAGVCAPRIPPPAGCSLAWRVPGRQRYRMPAGRVVEGDWSQAAFFLAMGVSVAGVSAASHQGDRACAAWMKTLRDPSRAGADVTISVAEIPDLAPALAACAAGRRGVTRLTDGARLRLKESDRLASTCALVNAVGGAARVEGDTLVIMGDGLPLRGGTVATCHDHRIAMAAAVLATFARGPVTVDDPDCVAKSYPGFWKDFDSLAVSAEGGVQ